MASGLSPEEQREIIARYQRLREEADQLYIKLSQVDSDRNEHELVLKQLTGLESDRRCWHQIGAVLAEKKVGEILPILTMNRDQFANVVKNLTAAVQQKDKEITELQTKYGITEVRK